jgi:serine/threonine-protein kinase
MSNPVELVEPVQIGRYLLHRQIARGGMATIHIARVLGELGFSRIVAAKRMRPELAHNREFVSMFLDEARIASRVNHRNVVPVLDVVTSNGEVVLVQEYAHGAPLSFLLRAAYRANTPVPLPVAVSIATQVLAGLHAAHETSDAEGRPLHIIHRDVSPQNIMIATDGTARLLDFGIAKAEASAHVTRKGTFKGKLAYAAPEQIRGGATQQSDIYALSVVLWELVVGDRLYRDARTEDDLIVAIMKSTPATVTEALAEERAWTSTYRWNQLEAIAPIIHKGLAGDARRRWSSAAEMEDALTAAVPIASGSDVCEWLRALGGEFLAERDRVIAAEEVSWRAIRPKSGREVRLDTDMSIAAAAAAVEPERAAPARYPARAPWLAAAGAFVALVALGAHLFATDPVPPPPASLVAPEPALALPPPPPAAPPPTTPPPASPPLNATVAPLPRPHPVHVATHPPAHTVHVAQPPPKVSSPPPPPPPAPLPAPPTQHAAPKDDCVSPYYYKGEKKIFKPQCI